MTARLEDIVPGVRLQGVVPGESLEVLGARWHGADSITVTYRSSAGLGQSVVYRDDEASLDVDSGERRPFDADPDDFKIAAEAQRIRLAGVHDPMLAVATSAVRPLPHQIRAVYGEMLPRRPLRFLLADDPGAGKTIMAGLLIKELLLREDVRRCLVVAPGGLVDQWQEELQEKFGLAFAQLSTAGADAGRTALGSDTLLLARMDQLARNDDLLAELENTSWDLVVVDEAHRMGAHWYGNTLDTTRRFQLGERLGEVTRHLLLMTATPHSGIEDDFQAFLSLLDRDAFTGRAGPGHRRADTDRVMRRMLKEDLLTFEGKPLFPERRAETVPYELTPPEQVLYDAVTSYVREGMNRAERLEDPRRRTVGFALTVLQRRLASSPAAIHASLQRRAARLRARAQDLADGVGLEPAGPAGREVPRQLVQALEEDQGDVSAEELEEVEGELVDGATAARTESELRTEVAELDALIEVASGVRRGGNDVKWSELRSILQDNVLITTQGEARKLIIFTEHRDTLDYLVERISTLIGIPDAVEAIHGGVSRAERRRIAAEFTSNPSTRVLVATDAAGEGLNLQAAHLMVNYDLPWNPNRIEQRFGRIHRIGQREVCRLWNLVAVTTREGQVFERLLTKIEEQRLAYGGKIFDVLGGDAFENRALRDVLMDAIRYGDRSDVRQRMDQTIDAGVAHGLDELVAERALASEMRPADVEAIRAQMDQARVRRLQPHYIEMAFRAGLERLGGRMARRERGRFQITRVPPTLLTRGTAVARAYERVTFDLEGVNREGGPRAELLAPGHPLHDEVMRACLQQWGPALRRGTVLISPDVSEPRLLVGVLEEVVDGTGESVARRFGYAVADADGRVEAAGVAAPYLDGIEVDMDGPVAERAQALPWLSGAENSAESWLIAHDVPRFLREVAPTREAEIDQTRLAVSSRLRAEINRLGSESLAAGEAERSGKRPRDSAESLLRRAGELEVRLEARLALLDRQRAMRTPPPSLTAAAILVPVSWAVPAGGDLPDDLPADEEGLTGEQATPEYGVLGRDLVDRRAVDAVLAAERALGRTPTEQPHHNKGFDIRSVAHDGAAGTVLLIEVKGRIAGARTVHVSYSQVMTAKNTGADHRLALVRVDPRGQQHDEVRYLDRAFASIELDSLFIAGIELDWDKAWARARPPF